MSRMTDLRAQYQFMAENAPETIRLLYQGVLMGVDLAAGAAAQDYAEKLEAELAHRPAANGDTPSWRKSPTTRGGRNPNLQVKVYALTDPRAADEPVFYVGSAQDPEAQLQDYIRSDEVKVSAKPLIDEIVGDGSIPGVRVLEEGVLLPDSTAAKERWITKLQAEGAALVNQRRGG
jgi:hypothetical protein